MKKVCDFLKIAERKTEWERGEEHSSPFLGPLQEGMTPICPTLTFERISDYTWERGRQRWARRESSTGVCGTAQMIRRCYNNEKSRVKITGHREKGVMWHSRILGYCLFLSVLSLPFFLSPALPHGAPRWHKYTCTLLGRREQMGPLFEPVMKTRKSITLSWQDICWFNISSLYMAISRGQICCSSVGIRIISKHNLI